MNCGDTFRFIENILKQAPVNGTEEHDIVYNALEKYVTDVQNFQIITAGREINRISNISERRAKILVEEEKLKNKNVILNPQVISNKEKALITYNQSIKQWRTQLPEYILNFNPTIQSQYSDTSNLRAVITTGGGTTLTSVNYIGTSFGSTDKEGNKITWKIFEGGWVWKGEYAVDKNTGRYEPQIVYDPYYENYLKLEEERKTAQKYLKSQVGNINTYPSCIRNIPKIKIKNITDQKTGNIFYFAHSENSIYGFNRDEGDYPVGGYYFTYNLKSSKDYKSGRYVCINDEISFDPDSATEEAAKSLLGKQIKKQSNIPNQPQDISELSIVTTTSRVISQDQFTFDQQTKLLEEKIQSGLDYLTLLILNEIAGITTYKNVSLGFQLSNINNRPYQNLKLKGEISSFITNICENLTEKYKTLCIEESYETQPFVESIIADNYFHKNSLYKKGGYFYQWNEYDRVWEKNWGLKLSETVSIVGKFSSSVLGWVANIVSFFGPAGATLGTGIRNVKNMIDAVTILSSSYLKTELLPSKEQNWGEYFGTAMVFALIPNFKVFDEIKKKTLIGSKFFESKVNPNYKKDALKYFSLLGFKFSINNANVGKFVLNTAAQNADEALQTGMRSLYKAGISAGFDLTFNDKEVIQILQEFESNIGDEFQSILEKPALVFNTQLNIFQEKTEFEKQMIEALRESQQFGTPYRGFEQAQKFCKKEISKYYVPSPEVLSSIKNTK